MDGDKLFLGVLGTISVGAFICCIVMIFYGIMGEGVKLDCLQMGYPDYRMDYKFQGYCVNMEGDVTIKVEKVE